ncbi:glycosyltransferase family 15 protein [Lentinula edodes]|uniref:Glycosyltransferase family 15 protein n=1 Tax=Lentinula edodes TaxID=5353 RepID=A0A1Q3EH98_LENED|nr:glycosyltransferase family 15 protein [Lentinula edodes]
MQQSLDRLRVPSTLFAEENSEGSSFFNIAVRMWRSFGVRTHNAFSVKAALFGFVPSPLASEYALLFSFSVSSVQLRTNASVQFGVIPSRHWYQPDWIDEGKAEQARNALKAAGVIYADSVSYRNMCRFNSGFFFHHPLLQQYRYYWRIEPDVDYFCQLQYDPFDYLKDNNKTYGFTIALEELGQTVTTLWQAVKEFMEQYPEYIHPNNALAFLSDNGGESFNLCHFWSNFEIADMDFWRGEAYTKFFEYLDSKGGFYYERWGDAPIHSIAAALFLDKTQLHFFNDIGYQHSNIMHCPQQPAFLTGSCTCNRVLSIDYRRYSCLPRYNKMLNGKW